MILEKATHSDFDRIYAEMEANFVPEERRDRDEAYALLNCPAYTVYHVTDGEKQVGFVTVWELEDFAFIEHFVTYPAFRNQGYGARALELLKQRFDTIVLEVEPPIAQMQARRIAFYRRCGFVLNNYPYRQPAYRAGGTGVELILMSYPNALEDCEQAVRLIYERVYAVKKV